MYKHRKICLNISYLFISQNNGVKTYLKNETSEIEIKGNTTVDEKYSFNMCLLINSNVHFVFHPKPETFIWSI